MPTDDISRARERELRDRAFARVMQLRRRRRIIRWTPAIAGALTLVLVGASLLSDDGSDRRVRVVGGPRSVTSLPVVEPGVTTTGGQGRVITSSTRTTAATSRSGTATTIGAPAPFRVVFTRFSGNASTIMTVNSDGSGLTALTNPATNEDKYPTWSPDGARISYTSTRGNAFRGVYTIYDIWLVGANGGPPTRVTQSTQRNGCSFSDWAPSGTQLVYSCDITASNNQLFIGGLGGSRRQITSAGTDNIAPDWSPDGTSIAFLRYVSNGYQIVLYDVASGAERVLTPPGSVEASHVRWSPDGRRMTYVRRNTAGGTSVWLASVDSMPGQMIADSALDPVWSPDGRAILITQVLGNGRQRLAVHRLDGAPDVVLTSPPAGFVDRYADAHR